MLDNGFDAQDVFRIGGKTYSRDECEAVYLFWKAILEEVEIRETINAVLENAGDGDRKFTRWVKSHMEECVEAVTGDEQQKEFFQNLLHQDGRDKMSTLASVEDCLRDLFTCSIESAS